MCSGLVGGQAGLAVQRQGSSHARAACRACAILERQVPCSLPCTRLQPSRWHAQLCMPWPDPTCCEPCTDTGGATSRLLARDFCVTQRLRSRSASVHNGVLQNCTRSGELWLRCSTPYSDPHLKMLGPILKCWDPMWARCCHYANHLAASIAMSHATCAPRLWHAVRSGRNQHQALGAKAKTYTGSTLHAELQHRPPTSTAVRGQLVQTR